MLATLLWPEKPEQKARRNLSQALYNMRQITSAASEELFDVTAKTIQLYVMSASRLICIGKSLQVVKQHQHSQPILCDDCRRQLAAAITLYRDEFLAGLYIPDSSIFEDWLRKKRDSYRRQYIETLHSLAHNSEMLGDYAAALKYLEQVQEIDLLNEEICRHHMRLMALSGQRNRSLQQYERFRQTPWDELETEPEESTQSLYQHLLSVKAAEDSPASPSQIPSMLRGG